MCGGSKSSQSTRTTNQDNRVTSGDGSYIVDASGGSQFTLNDVSSDIVMESIAKTGVNLENFLEAAGSVVDRAFDENAGFLNGAIDLAELSQGQTNEVLEASETLALKTFDMADNFNEGSIEISQDVLDASTGLAENFREGSIELSEGVLDASNRLADDALSQSLQFNQDTLSASEGLLSGGLSLVNDLLSAGQNLVSEGLSLSRESATDSMQFTRDIAQDTATPGRETMSNIFYAAAALVAAVMIFGGSK